MVAMTAPRRRGWALGAVPVLVLAGWAGAEPETVKLGELLDRTGSIATPSWSASVDLAVHQINAALEHGGAAFRFALVRGDSKNLPATARAEAIELVHAKGAKALITDSSQDDIAVHALVLERDPAQRIEVPVVCVACTSPLINNAAASDVDATTQEALRNPDGFNFRTTLSDAYQARVLAHWMETGTQKRAAFKVGIYASDDPYGRGFSDVLKSDLEKSAKKCTVEQLYHPVQADAAKYDWAKDVGKLLDSHNANTGQDDGPPDFVVEITFPKFAAAFTKAFLTTKTQTRLIHTHNFRSVRVTAPIGGLINGQEGTSQAVLGLGAGASAFAEELKAATGHPPAFRDAPAYDAAVLLMLGALTKLGSTAPSALTGAQIRDGMRHLSEKQGAHVPAGKAGLATAVSLIREGKPINYDGASGPCDFDALGNIVADVVQFRYEKGDFVDLQRYACTQDPKCPAEQ
jgi:ABC-type branched-subunit amino acid transport system substrate-binding protein